MSLLHSSYAHEDRLEINCVVSWKEKPNINLLILICPANQAICLYLSNYPPCAITLHTINIKDKCPYFLPCVPLNLIGYAVSSSLTFL